MSRRNIVLVWLGILLLSGTFLLGQQSWPPPQGCMDTDEDGYGNPASPFCTHSGFDCDDDPADDPSICSTCTCEEIECAPCARCIHPGAAEGPYGDPTCSDTLDNDCDGIGDSPDDGCVKGVILAEELDVSDNGYTVMRVWGSHYEMGYAHASLLGDCIVDGVAQFKQKVGLGYDGLRNLVESAVWQPPQIEDEFDGMVDCLDETHPAANIDEIDLKVMNTVGDWGSLCRSHICWGRYVEEPIKTLATRRLDYTTPVPEGNHHVLCAWDPDDGSPEWVNLAWAGFVTVVTAVNEFGTVVSLHDYNTHIKDLSAGRMSRMVAARHALTFPAGPDLSTHLAGVFAELQGYEIMTHGFLNFYTPEGHGGVMTANPYETGPDFYHLRLPQAVWHHGEAMITTNAWTVGTTTPPDEDFGADVYYDDDSAKTLASHWDLLATDQNPQFLSLHLLSVAYRGQGNMTLWADGRLDGTGRTPRLEWEWSELFDVP